MDKTEAAQKLGAAVHEVLDVVEEAFGHVVHLFDGSSYVIVPADKPDVAGNTGVMWLHKPTDRYHDTMPVFSAPAGAAGAPPEPPEPVVTDTPPAIPADGSPTADAQKALGIDSSAAADTPTDPAGAAPDAAPAVPVKGKTS